MTAAAIITLRYNCHSSGRNIAGKSGVDRVWVPKAGSTAGDLRPEPAGWAALSEQWCTVGYDARLEEGPEMGWTGCFPCRFSL